MICLVLGAQGSGKTLFLTKEAYATYRKGKDVYSNFKLNFPHKVLKFRDMINTNLENCTVLIDEGALWGLNSRDSMSRDNKKLTVSFISQCRKKGVDLFISAQIVRLLDCRVRENASYFIFCEKWVKVNGGWMEAVEGVDYGKVPTVIQQEIVNMGSEKVKKTFFVANDFFGLYDTSEIIKQQESNDV